MVKDSRVFEIYPEIDMKIVNFTNRYGYTLAGHMYLPENFDSSKKYPAIVVSGAFGAVKEQTSGLYAQEMAKKGYVAVAFDQSSTGESSGFPRNVASPEIFTEDFSAAVDFFITKDFVDSDNIGVIGICGLGGMALNAAAVDKRIKAVATSVMYDNVKKHLEWSRGLLYS